MKPPVVVCFSGGIGSGKSSLAAAVAARSALPIASFGAFVRSTAEARGIRAERENLQALGEALIAELGWENFCHSVLSSSGWTSGSLLVDGIRHVAAFDEISRVVAPIETKLVFVEAAEDLRQARLDATRPEERTALSRAETHSTERDIVRGDLRSRANLVLDGTRALEELVDRVCSIYGVAEGSRDQ